MASGLENIETIESPFRRFVTTIGVFPTAFTDAMTYYECLAYLVKYMEDTMIPAINENAEAVEELQGLYIQLKTFVDTYFDNLDVQEEINNKLDQMVQDGTLQEIIDAYLDSNITWVFDTVADMKQATNLIAGSDAKTLGFYAINDGGGATYHITSTGTANEMDVIAVNGLYANLISDDVNVKQFGAYGDNTHSDDTVFARAVSYAQTNDKVLFVPVGVYKLDNAISMKHLKIKCLGELNNTNAITLGASSTGSTNTDVYIFKCKDVIVEGAKVSKFEIVHCGNLTLQADGSTTDNTSIAYNKFNGIEVSSITITGSNGGWINENEFNIKRCLGNLTITSTDGSYGHNNNRFNNICIEGSTKTINIEYGHNNYITYRGEQRPVVVIGNHPAYTYSNTVLYQYNSTAYNLFQNDYTQDNTAVIQPEFVPTYRIDNLLTLTKYNAKNLDSSVYINSEGNITSAWSNLFNSEKIDADKPFSLIGKCDTKSIRIEFKCFDENDQQIQGNCGGAGISYTNNAYNMSANGDVFYFTFYPSDEVKKIQFRVYSGNNVNYSKVTLDLIQPFLNDLVIPNTISTTKRYANSNPGEDTNTNHYWTAGDFVYCKNSSLGLLGWCCQYAGNPGTWKSVALDS